MGFIEQIYPIPTFLQRDGSAPKKEAGGLSQFGDSLTNISYFFFVYVDLLDAL